MITKVKPVTNTQWERQRRFTDKNGKRRMVMEPCSFQEMLEDEAIKRAQIAKNDMEWKKRNG